MTVRKMECLKVNRNRVPSSPTMPQAAVATASDWGDHLAHDAAAGVGGAGQDRVESELFGGGLLQAAEEDVTGGIGAGQEDPNQPRNGARNGNQWPVLVKARPRQLVMPEVFMT